MKLFDYTIPHLLTSLIAGILLGTLIGSSFFFFTALVCCSVFLIGVAFWRGQNTQTIGTYKKGVAATIYGAFVFLGIVLSYFNEPLHHSSHYAHFKSTYQGYYEVQLIEKPDPKSKVIVCPAEVLAVKKGGDYIKTSGKIMVAFEKDAMAENLNYGDRLLVKGYLNEVMSSNNPGSFDYAEYLRAQGIYHQMFVGKGEWKVTLNNAGNSLKHFAIQTRDNTVQFLEQKGMGFEELAVTSALLLGDKSLLDYRQTQSYSTAGAMHVLAVSGLHVGVILLLLQFLFKPLKRLRFLYVLLILVGIWSFALLTGFSSSVIRAATMFSLVGVGQALYRNQNIYHTIAASAFILLLIDSSLLFDVGFQLSYAAVVGIVYLQPKIYQLLFIPNKWVDKIWKLTAVSIAAQLATFPLAAYYFHLFPTYFFITNIFVIPLAVAILYIGVVALVFSWLDPFASILVQLLNGVVWVMNKAVALVEWLPYSRLGEIRFTWSDTLLLYGFLLLFLVWENSRKKAFFKYAVVLFLVFWGGRLSHDMYRMNQLQWMVLHQNGTPVQVFTEGHSALWHVQRFEDNRVDQLESGLTTAFGIMRNTRKKLDKAIYSFNGNRIWVYNDQNSAYLKEYNGEYIWLTNNEYLPFQLLTSLKSRPFFILDGSSSYYYKRSVKRVLKSLNLEFHDTSEKGAFIKSI